MSSKTQDMVITETRIGAIPSFLLAENGLSYWLQSSVSFVFSECLEESGNEMYFQC